MYEQVLNEVIPKYKDKINSYKVNIEEESQLSEIFEVGHIPHFVMISKGGGVSPGDGALNKDTLKYFLEYDRVVQLGFFWKKIKKSLYGFKKIRIFIYDV